MATCYGDTHRSPRDPCAGNLQPDNIIARSNDYWTEYAGGSLFILIQAMDPEFVPNAVPAAKGRSHEILFFVF